MERDWKWSLLQPNSRHANELSDLDARQLQDIGLKRNDIGQIVLAEDPTRLVPQVGYHSIVSCLVDQAYHAAKRVLGGARVRSF